MYLLIPNYFTIAQLSELDNVLGIFSRTFLSKGLRICQQQCSWIALDQDSTQNDEMIRCHWLSILYRNEIIIRQKLNVYDYNAIVFRENNRIILETITNIKFGSIIQAIFYNIEEDDLTVTIWNENRSEINYSDDDDDKTAIDLSQKSNETTKVQITVIDKMKKSKGNKRRMLSCDVCAKQFDRPSLLKRHVRTHTGERPYVCAICEKSFSTFTSLNTHRRIHSGERPHQCLICGKKFTASSNLYYHRMTHFTEKPHKCDICPKSFPTPGNLRKHRYSHGNSSPFKCPICYRIFVKQVNLRNHTRLHHSNIELLSAEVTTAKVSTM